MKVTITKSELLTILSERARCKITDIIIVESFPLVSMYDKIYEAIKSLMYWDQQKIRAIRTLIDLSANDPDFDRKLTLRDAKWAIENFKDFLEFVRKHNRLPAPEFSLKGMH